MLLFFSPPYYAPLLQQGPLPVWHFPSSWGESSPPDNETERSDKKVRNAGGPQRKGVPAWRTGGRGKKTHFTGKSISTVIFRCDFTVNIPRSFFLFFQNTWFFFRFSLPVYKFQCIIKIYIYVLLIINLFLLDGWPSCAEFDTKIRWPRV